MPFHLVGATVFGIEAFPIRLAVHSARATSRADEATERFDPSGKEIHERVMATLHNSGFEMPGAARSDARAHEAHARVMAALQNSGFEVPDANYRVHREPAYIGRGDPSLDLALAVAWLAAAGYLTNTDLSAFLITGELALDGTVRPVRGALSIAGLARKLNIKNLILPTANIPEAALIDSVCDLNDNVAAAAMLCF